MFNQLKKNLFRINLILFSVAALSVLAFSQRPVDVKYPLGDTQFLVRSVIVEGDSGKEKINNSDSEPTHFGGYRAEQYLGVFEPDHQPLSSTDFAKKIAKLQKDNRAKVTTISSVTRDGQKIVLKNGQLIHLSDGIDPFDEFCFEVLPLGIQNAQGKIDLLYLPYSLQMNEKRLDGSRGVHTTEQSSFKRVPFDKYVLISSTFNQDQSKLKLVFFYAEEITK